MLHDQHVHSNYSLDSDVTLESYYLIAEKYNIKYFITTEHVEFDSMYNNQDWIVDFKKLRNELNNLHQQYPNVNPLVGIEIGYRKDHILDMDSMLNQETFDVVNMSIHDNGVYDYYLKDAFINVGIDNMLDIYFNNILDGLNNYHNFDILSHFDYGFKTAYLIDNTLTINKYEDIIRKIFRKVISLNKTLEINLKVQQVLGDVHLKTWLTWYKEEGGQKLSMSSDSHTVKSYETFYQLQSNYFNIIKESEFNELRYFINRQEYIYVI